MNRKMYDILKVKNALLRRVYHVSQDIICHHSSPPHTLSRVGQWAGWNFSSGLWLLTDVGNTEQG